MTSESGLDNLLGFKCMDRGIEDFLDVKKKGTNKEVGKRMGNRIWTDMV